jgi:hypothetical protein
VVVLGGQHRRLSRAERGEQRRLGLEVPLLVAVEVEVVAAQVEERGDGEARPADARQGERVRGDLHGDDLDRQLAHPREQGVQLRRLGSRALERPPLGAE